MPWTVTEVPPGVEKLDPEKVDAWVTVANKALDEGYDDGHAIAIAWAVVNRMESSGSSVAFNYPAFRPGTFTASVGGEFDVEPEDVDNMAEAVNKLYSLGHPVAMIDGHGSGSAIGIMPAARVEDGVMRACVVGDWWAVDGIKQGVYGLSVEAMRDYSSEAYTGGETFKYWPTAWAVLPAGEQPAVPPGEPIAAKEPEHKPVRLYAQEQAPPGGASPNERGQVMDKEIEARIEALEKSLADGREELSTLKAENGELKSKLEAAEKERDELKQATEAAQIEAAEKEVEGKTEELLARKLPGVREKIQTRIEAAEGPQAKLAVIKDMDELFDDMTTDEQKLYASEGKPDVGGESKDDTDRKLEQVEKLQASEGITYADALNRVFGKE